MVLEVDTNWVKATTPPFQFMTKDPVPTTTSSMRFDATPWLGTRVSVTGNSPHKGYHGTIKDVLCNQSRLRFQVELDSFPVKLEIIDHDNLLDALWVVT